MVYHLQEGYFKSKNSYEEVQNEYYRIVYAFGSVKLITRNNFILKFIKSNIIYIKNCIILDDENCGVITVVFDNPINPTYKCFRYGYENCVVYPQNTSYGNHGNTYDMLENKHQYNIMFSDQRKYYKKCLLKFKNFEIYED